MTMVGREKSQKQLSSPLGDAKTRGMFEKQLHLKKVSLGEK
jgi:hypothetical protein